MRVLDDGQHGVLLRGSGQDRQRRNRDQERLDRRAVLLTERDPQRPGLRSRKLLAQAHDREQQSVQGREGEGRLDLETLGPQHEGITRARDQVLEQRRLADTRLTPDDQACRGPVSSALEEFCQTRRLRVATD